MICGRTLGHTSTCVSLHTLQLPGTQASHGDLFSQDGSQSQDVSVVDREELDNYMGPAAIDGFLGVGHEMMDVNDNDTVEAAMEGVMACDIPAELLVTLPIMDVPPGTKIIPMNTTTPIPAASSNPMEIPNTSGETQPGTSGMQHITIGTLETGPLEGARVIQSVPQATPSSMVKNPSVPKKGFNMKNPGKKTQAKTPTAVQTRTQVNQPTKMKT